MMRWVFCRFLLLWQVKSICDFNTVYQSSSDRIQELCKDLAIVFITSTECWNKLMGASKAWSMMCLIGKEFECSTGCLALAYFLSGSTPNRPSDSETSKHPIPLSCLQLYEYSSKTASRAKELIWSVVRELDLILSVKDYGTCTNTRVRSFRNARDNRRIVYELISDRIGSWVLTVQYSFIITLMMDARSCFW